MGEAHSSSPAQLVKRRVGTLANQGIHAFLPAPLDLRNVLLGDAQFPRPFGLSLRLAFFRLKHPLPDELLDDLTLVVPANALHLR